MRIRIPRAVCNCKRAWIVSRYHRSRQRAAAQRVAVEDLAHPIGGNCRMMNSRPSE